MKQFTYYFDHLFDSLFAIAQTVGNVNYCHYCEPIKGTQTITGSQFRAYDKFTFAQHVDDGRFELRFQLAELPSLPDDKRLSVPFGTVYNGQGI